MLMIDEQKDNCGSFRPTIGKPNVMGSTVEIWLSIPEYEGLYEVSNLCRVKSLSKRIQRGKYNAWRNLPERILIDTLGDVSLVKNKKKKTFDMQTLYKIVFDGFIPDGKRKINLLKVNDEIKQVKRRQFCQIVKSMLQNKSCKSMGVSKIKDKFIAHICINQKDIHLGSFEEEKKAYKFYILACNNEKLYNGNAKDFRSKLQEIETR